MKAAPNVPLVLGLCILPLLVFCLVLSPRPARAQESGALDTSANFSREQLAQMLAPVALYPDVLLSQVLMAATYPIEIIEADRWVRQHPTLKDKALDAELLTRDWDPSVKALCHFPSILTLMSERIAETTNLGNAFLAQEAEVLATVQELRAKARAEGNLATTSEQKVIVEKETIVIQPADPRTIYVPYYDPFYVYGPWWYPAFPPYYWHPVGVRLGVGIAYWPGIHFGFVFGTWSHFDWHHHHIHIDVHKRPRFVRHDHWRSDSGRWHHVTRHRRGVAYRDQETARRFGQQPARVREFGRDTRGFSGRSGDQRIRVDRGLRSVAPPAVERDRQRQQRDEQVERQRQQRQSDDRLRQERQRSDRERVERQRQDRTRIERQLRVPSERSQPQRFEREQRGRSRDNVFNRVGEGRRERHSSERGRSSRKRLDDGGSNRGRR